MRIASLIDYPKQQEINSAAGVALLERIGPAVLLTHSQSGAFGWPIADRRPDLVKAIVAVLDSGFARSLSSGRASRGPGGAPRNDG